MALYKFGRRKVVDGIKEDSVVVVKDLGNGRTLCIPFVDDNTDYQEYLEWVAEGNTADPAEGLTWDDIRVRRDGILQSTDWTMTTGATVDQAQWAAYRQVIRDIPQTYKDKTPDDVVWPTQPSTAGPNS